MKRIAIAVACAVGLGLPAAAHHGFYMNYATGAAYWIEGTVTEAYFGPPHADLTIAYERVSPPEAPAGADAYWDRLEKMPRIGPSTVEIEFPQQDTFYALDGVFEVGDRVAVIAYRGCDDPEPFRGQWVRLPDGETRVARGVVQSEVKRCPIKARSRD